MEYKGFLSVNDNVYKFLCLLGIGMLLFAIVYPNDKLKEYKLSESEAILKKELLIINISCAIEQTCELTILSERTNSQNVKDSIQKVSDDIEVQIKIDKKEIDHANRLNSFSAKELSTFYNYRNSILIIGAVLFFIGIVFWMVYYHKGSKAK